MTKKNETKLGRAEREFEAAGDALREAEKVWFESHDPHRAGSPLDTALAEAIRAYRSKLTALVSLELDIEEGIERRA